MKRLLLGSGGMRTEKRLQAWITEVDDFLAEVKEVLFIPYAIADHDAYVQGVQAKNLHAGRQTLGIHHFEDPVAAIQQAQAIHVGGGNSFRLLHALQEKNLLQPIRERVLAGIPYMGVSAGSNAACPSIKTTNDMPIVCPQNFEALNLVPFQINPHYTPGTMHYEEEGQLIPYGGETRDDRLREFHEMNTTPVVALTEGTILRVEGEDITVKGPGFAKLLQVGQDPQIFKAEEKLIV